jgi:putative hydrolase of the HAD superfamily
VKKYKHLFFDLDRTLWDWNANSETSLRKLYQLHLSHSGYTYEEFERYYNQYNDQMWVLFRENKIKKEEFRVQRFRLSLNEIGIDSQELAEKLSTQFMDESPRGTRLMPNALEILDYLQSRYHLHILSNGFRDIQHIKMSGSGLTPYFKKIITSESCGYLKPDKRIFHYALSSTNCRKENALMIGDEIDADIMGALNFGIDQVFYNPQNVTHKLSPTFEIDNLKQLKEFL